MENPLSMIARLLAGPQAPKPWGVPGDALATTATNPVGWSTTAAPQYMSNPDPSFSELARKDKMTPQQAVGAMLLGKGRPITNAQLPAAEDKAQTFMDYGMAVAGATNPVGIRAYHGSPHTFDRFDPESAATWFSTNEATAKNFGKDRMPGVGINNPRFGGNANVWRDAKPNMYEANIAAENLQTIDPMKEARKIAKEIGAPRPKTWDDAAEILQWGRAQEMWLDEAKAAGKSGVLFKNVGDDPMGLVSDHVAVLDTKIIDILRRYGLLGLVGGGAAATGSNPAEAKQ